MPTVVSRASLKTTTGLNILLGLWLFASPWVYGADINPDAWNSWIIGVLIALFAAIRYSDPATGRMLSVLNMLMGLWVFASPWIFAYTFNTPRFANSLIVGAAVFMLGMYGSTAVSRIRERPPQPH